MPYSRIPLRVENFQFEDVVQQAQACQGWDVSYAQISSGSYRGEIEHVDLGTLKVMLEDSDKVVTQTGAAARGHYVFGVLLNSGPETRFNGVSWHHGIAASGSGREFCLRSDGARMLLLEVSDHTLVPLFATSCGGSLADLFRHGAARFDDPRSVHRFAQTLSRTLSVASAMENEPIEVQRNWRRSSERELLDVLADVLTSGAPHDAQIGMAHANRVTVVSRALAYMQDHIDQLLQVIDICESLQISRRTLQSCFSSITGTNPQSFLRAHRLSGARSDLMRGGPSMQVKDVVMKWGFWHLSRFSESYRQHFGELPSQTARRACVERETQREFVLTPA